MCMCVYTMLIVHLLSTLITSSSHAHKSSCNLTFVYDNLSKLEGVWVCVCIDHLMIGSIRLVNSYVGAHAQHVIQPDT